MWKIPLILYGKVEDELPNIIKESSDNSVVFIDPPRKGCEKSVLETLIQLKPEKIVYVSCNPATLARDLKILTQSFRIDRVQPVDMFPYTSHIESIAVLKLKK